MHILCEEPTHLCTVEYLALRQFHLISTHLPTKRHTQSPPCSTHHALLLHLIPELVRMLILLRLLHMVPALYVCFVSHLAVCLTILNFWVCLIGPPIEAVPCVWSSSSPLECFLFLLRPFKNGRNQTVNGIQNVITLLITMQWSDRCLCCAHS